ncbi:MAG: ECF transporter S component [Lachnospiraceae bacterium]|nr:ECF transporter S component [Lachnospiraceae bacterium]
MDERLKKQVVAAAFAAITCVATMVIKVPTLGTNGYVNIGDSTVLLSAWLLGNPYGALAAGIGSALADLLSGYASYVPGTAVIKFFMAFVCSILYRVIKEKKVPQIIAYIISAVVAELIMAGGYFIYEATLLGYGFAAAASIISNLIQAGICIVIGIALVFSLSPVYRKLM